MTRTTVDSAQQAHDSRADGAGWLSRTAAADAAAADPTAAEADVAAVTSWLVFALAHAHQGSHRSCPLDQDWRAVWKVSFQRAVVRTVAQALPDTADAGGSGAGDENCWDGQTIHGELIGVTDRLMSSEATRLAAHERQLRNFNDGDGDGKRARAADLAAIKLTDEPGASQGCNANDTPLHQGMHLALLSKDRFRAVVDRVVARASAPMVPECYLAARTREMLALIARSFDQSFAAAVSMAAGHVTNVESISATRMRTVWEAAHRAAEAEHALQAGSLNLDCIRVGIECAAAADQRSVWDRIRQAFTVLRVHNMFPLGSDARLTDAKPP